MRRRTTVEAPSTRTVTPSLQLSLTYLLHRRRSIALSAERRWRVAPPSHFRSHRLLRRPLRLTGVGGGEILVFQDRGVVATRAPRTPDAIGLGDTARRVLALVRQGTGAVLASRRVARVAGHTRGVMVVTDIGLAPMVVDIIGARHPPRLLPLLSRSRVEVGTVAPIGEAATEIEIGGADHGVEIARKH